MLVALDADGVRAEATPTLEKSEWRCPMCQSPVTLKRGRIVRAHFAHQPSADCPWRVGESWRHLAAKRALADMFTSRGWKTRLEVAHPAAGRRVDVGVYVPDTAGEVRPIAIEVQDSAISVDEMKSRVAVDRRLGYMATAWLFTNHRASALLSAVDGGEVRVPNEIRWVDNRFGAGVTVIDSSSGIITVLRLFDVVREGSSHEWYDSDGELTRVTYPDQRLKTVKTVAIDRRSDAWPVVVPGRYAGELTVRWS